MKLQGRRQQFKFRRSEWQLEWSCTTGSWMAKSEAPGRGTPLKMYIWARFGYLGGVKLKP